MSINLGLHFILAVAFLICTQASATNPRNFCLQSLEHLFRKESIQDAKSLKSLVYELARLKLRESPSDNISARGATPNVPTDPLLIALSAKKAGLSFVKPELVEKSDLLEVRVLPGSPLFAFAAGISKISQKPRFVLVLRKDSPRAIPDHVIEDPLSFYFYPEDLVQTANGLQFFKGLEYLVKLKSFELETLRLNNSLSEEKRALMNLDWSYYSKSKPTKDTLSLGYRQHTKGTKLLVYIETMQLEQSLAMERSSHESPEIQKVHAEIGKSVSALAVYFGLLTKALRKLGQLSEKDPGLDLKEMGDGVLNYSARINFSFQSIWSLSHQMEMILTQTEKHGHYLSTRIPYEFTQDEGISIIDRLTFYSQSYDISNLGQVPNLREGQSRNSTQILISIRELGRSQIESLGVLLDRYIQALARDYSF